MATFTYQERFRTAKGVFDEFTQRHLFELQSREVFDELVSPIEVGKESNVFIAAKGKEKVIVKIYRVQNCDFKRMYDYIRKDPRYEHLRKHRREIIFAWVQREYANLLRAQEAGVATPVPIAWRNHILVESLIGDKDPAPQLKDAPPAVPEKFFGEVVENMRKLYQKGLIHGDLSAFNILNWKEKPYLIDFSQSTLTKTPNWEELLFRDVKNMVRFFLKLGVKTSKEELLESIRKV